MGKYDAGLLERFGTSIDRARRYSSMLWRVTALMAKGAFLVNERRRLIAKLGEDVYERIQSGELKHESWEPLVHQLDRLTKKIEIEEMLVRNARFGSSSRATPESSPLEEVVP